MANYYKKKDKEVGMRGFVSGEDDGLIFDSPYGFYLTKKLHYFSNDSIIIMDNDMKEVGIQRQKDHISSNIGNVLKRGKTK